jgi:hypothetical protein
MQNCLTEPSPGSQEPEAVGIVRVTDAVVRHRGVLNIYINKAGKIQCCGSGSRAFLKAGSGIRIRDGEKFLFIRIRDEHPRLFFRMLKNGF